MNCMLCKFNMSVLFKFVPLLSTVDGRFTFFKFRSTLLLRKISNICINADIQSQ